MEITTSDAAKIINVSTEYVDKLVSSGLLELTLHSTIEYKQNDRLRRKDVLKELAQEGQKLLQSIAAMGKAQSKKEEGNV